MPHLPHLPQSSVFSRLHLLVPLLVLSWLAVPVTGHANVITVDFDSIVVPGSDDGSDISPYYSCEGGAIEEARRCAWLWLGGLELVSPSPGDSGLYADGFISMIDGGLGDYTMRPRCEPALAPCFETFTPLLLELDTYGITPFYVGSSRGGLQEFLVFGSDSAQSITFHGDEWRDLEWLAVGFYIPDDCENREDLNCRSLDPWLSHLRLTFEAEIIPEPIGLLPLGLVLFGLRHRPLGAIRTFRHHGRKLGARSDDRRHGPPPKG